MRRRVALGVGAGVLFAAMVAGALRPVCVPIEDEVAARAEPPLAERPERLLGVRVFQLRDGRWHQCKPWLWRQGFF